MGADPIYIESEIAGRFAKWNVQLKNSKAVPMVVIGAIIDGPLEGNAVIMNSQGKGMKESIDMLTDLIRQLKAQSM